MKIVLLKKHKLHSKTLKKGAELSVTKEKALELIEKGIAKELNGKTKEEKTLEKELQKD
jgi:hypothetical protein